MGPLSGQETRDASTGREFSGRVSLQTGSGQGSGMSGLHRADVTGSSHAGIRDVATMSTPQG